jgi:hypothetical protein
MKETIDLGALLGEDEDSDPIYSITEAWVTDNEEGPRYWVMNRPYACGQTRLQIWHERQREEAYPAIFSEM